MHVDAKAARPGALKHARAASLGEEAAILPADISQWEPRYIAKQTVQELFENFYYIWAKLKSGDAECKDVEWKRRMHFVLDQLKSGKTLSTR